MKSKQLTIFLNHARKELQRYNSNKKVVHLQQMGEKMWNAYIYLLESVSKIEIKSRNQVYNIRRKLHDKDITELGGLCSNLHVFFYEGAGDDFYIKKNYHSARKLFTKLRKKYKI